MAEVSPFDRALARAVKSPYFVVGLLFLTTGVLFFATGIDPVFAIPMFPVGVAFLALAFSGPTSDGVKDAGPKA